MRATWLYLVIAFLSLISYAIAIFFSIQPVLLESWPPEAVAGKKVWQQKGCVECHTLLGNGGYAASDLTKITQTASYEELLTFLTRPPVVPPSRHKPSHPALTREEAEKILYYLEQVSKIDNRGWPPRPFATRSSAGGK